MAGGGPDDLPPKPGNCQTGVQTLTLNFTLLERLVYGAATLVLLGCLVLTPRFLPEEFSAWVWVLSGILGFLMAMTLAQFLLSLQKVTLGPQGAQVRRWRGRDRFDWSEVVSWREDPGAGWLEIRTQNNRFRLSRRLRPWDQILRALDQWAPDKKDLRTPGYFRTTWWVFGVYAGFLLACLTFWALFTLQPGSSPGEGVFFTVLSWGMAGALALRLLFWVPTGFTFQDTGFKIHYLLRQRFLAWDQVQSCFRDHYAASGALYHLLRINLKSGRAVIMDEMVLHQTLGTLDKTLKDHLDRQDLV